MRKLLFLFFFALIAPIIYATTYYADSDNSNYGPTWIQIGDRNDGAASTGNTVSNNAPDVDIKGTSHLQDSGYYVGAFENTGILANASTQNTSELWGVTGELWDSTGRLPDFSHAGYHAGEDSIPNMAVVASVKDFGAKGDGVTDDYQAFKDAIAAVNNGAILIPKGRYIVNGLLNLNKSNIVLRGEGNSEDGTIIYFPKTLTSIFGGTTTEPWVYGYGGLLWVGSTSGSVTGSKISDVSNNSTRGSKILNVNDASGITPGQYIVLKMNDQSDHSLLYHLHNNQVDASDYLSFPGNRMAWPVKVVAVNGNQIKLEKYLRFDVRIQWSPAIYNYTPLIEESGIENLRIETPDQEYPGHLVDYGYNGFTLKGAFNCWAINITVKNAENGADINLSKNCEIRGLKIYGGTKVADAKDAVGTFGHHGISFSNNSVDNVLTDFYVYDKYIHDVTIQTMSNGNVIKRGIGHDMNFDFHKYSPFENLFSDINVGLGSRVYQSSGGSAFGPHSAARETFWNLNSISWDKPYVPEWGYIQTNVIPADTDSTTAEKEWYEMINDIQPKELYSSQLFRRLGDSIEASSVMAPMVHPKSGIYGGNIEVSIFSLNPDDVVRYTTDGTEPDSMSTVYGGPFTINASDQDSFTVMAKVFDGSVEVSPLAMSKYLKDTTPPDIVGYGIINAKAIRISFNEPIDTATTEDIYNYYISYNNSNYILLDSIEIYKIDAVNLYLSQSFVDGFNYTINLFNIKDFGGNVIDSDKSFINFNYAKKMVTASTYQEGNPPENVLDKDLSTRWSAEGYDVWLVYDLGGVEKVYGVKIALYKGDTRNTIFSLSLSEDGENWIQVFDGQSGGNTTGLETYSFDTVDARYVKINSKGNNSDNGNEKLWNSYTELEVLIVDTAEPEPPSFIEQNFVNSVKIYPNPADIGDYVNIDLSGYNANADVVIKIMDVTGKLAYSEQLLLNSEHKIIQLNISNLNKGIYFITIINGTHTQQTNLIVKQIISIY